MQGFQADELERLPACHLMRLVPAQQRAAALESWFENVIAKRTPPRVETHGANSVIYHWQRLAFDTEQLGVEAARIDYLLGDGNRDTALRHILREAAALGVQHLSYRLDAGDIATMHLLEAHEFRLVDGLLTFSRSLDGSLPAPQLPFSPASLDDVAALRDLGMRGFRHDRFHADDSLAPGAADRLHAQWLENAVRGSAADAVLVHEAEGGMRGAITFSIDDATTRWLGGPVGTIGLVVTAPGWHGRGIATALTAAALADMARRGARWCLIGTQLRNIGASRVYEASGFRLLASSITMRRLLA
jgi:GNAT superfamily N-acetyltransferase